MIVLEAGMWLAWGLLFLGWTVPAVMGIIYVARGRADYDTEYMLGFSATMFLVWGFLTAVMYMVVR